MRFTFTANTTKDLRLELAPDEFEGLTLEQAETAIIDLLQEIEPGAYFDPYEVEDAARRLTA